MNSENNNDYYCAIIIILLIIEFLGTAVLTLTSTDVDKSGASYYGEQTLQFVSTSGDSNMVQLGN